jgi:hypothetical protein
MYQPRRLNKASVWQVEHRVRTELWGALLELLPPPPTPPAATEGGGGDGPMVPPPSFGPCLVRGGSLRLLASPGAPTLAALASVRLLLADTTIRACLPHRADDGGVLAAVIYIMPCLPACLPACQHRWGSAFAAPQRALTEAEAWLPRLELSRAFPSWNRSILTEIYLCNSCSYHEIHGPPSCGLAFCGDFSAPTRQPGGGGAAPEPSTAARVAAPPSYACHVEVAATSGLAAARHVLEAVAAADEAGGAPSVDGIIGGDSAHEADRAWMMLLGGGSQGVLG